MPKRGEREIRAEQLGDLALTMKSEAGRRLMRRILAYCCMYESVFTPRKGVLPEERLVYNGAIRDVAQWLEEEVMSADPDGFMRMNSEARNRAIMDVMPAPKQAEENENDASAT
jgi:hypothetical protein